MSSVWFIHSLDCLKLLLENLLPCPKVRQHAVHNSCLVQTSVFAAVVEGKGQESSYRSCGNVSSSTGEVSSPPCLIDG